MTGFAYKDSNDQWQRIGDNWFWPVGAEDWFPPNWPDTASQEDRDQFFVAEIVSDVQPIGAEVRFAAPRTELVDVGGVPHASWEVVYWTREDAVASMKDWAMNYAQSVASGPLPVADIVPNQTFLAKVDVASQVKALFLGLQARDAIAAAQPMTIMFEDESVPKQKVTLSTPEQVEELAARIGSFPIACDVALIVTNGVIDDAYDNDASVADIRAIDITAEFPALVVAFQQSRAAEAD